MLVIYGIYLEPWLLFAARASRLCGVDARLIIRDPIGRQMDGDEKDCLKWLNQFPTISLERIRDTDLASLRGDTCFVGLRGCYGETERSQIRMLISGFTRRVGLLRFASDSPGWQAKKILRELHQPFYSLFTELWTEDIHLWLLRAFLRKPHRYFGAFPHQRCSVGQEYWDLLGSDPPFGHSPKLFSWAGSANCHRDSVANWVEAMLVENGGAINLGPMDGVHKVVWHYDRPGSQRPRPYADYLSELESSWFCLCLPGATGTTHRVLESILRGAVPVLQEEQVPFHGLPLRDGVNAIFVKGRNWEGAIRRIARTSNIERLAMQRAVLDLGRTTASLSSISQRLTQAIMGEGKQCIWKT